MGWEWTSIGTALGLVGYAVWQAIEKQKAKTKNDKEVARAKQQNVEDVKLAKSRVQHNEADQTAQEIIKYYKEKIEILEAQHVDNEARITTLEEQVTKQTEILEQQKKYIESLVELVQGRDPAIQAFLKVSETTIEKFNGDTAPKVDELHKHILGGGEKK